jgi:short-subunit dehydrogenase
MRKIIVITGASGGIGAALARELAKGGHKLVLAARRREELEQVAREAREAGAAAALAVTTDVTRREQVERLRDHALEEFGQIDVWVNNAGRGIGKKVLDLTDADFDEMMTVNVKSALYGMQAAVPHFQQRGSGHLINVSSFLGRVPLVGFRSAYNAAKAALNALTANLRMDLRTESPGVHVSLVMPGVVTTEFANNALGAASGSTYQPPAHVANAQTPEEVAAAIAELIEHPRAEIFTNPAQEEIARRYYEDIADFEDRM